MPAKKKTKTDSTSSNKPKISETAKASRKAPGRPKKIVAPKSPIAKTSKNVLNRITARKLPETSGESIQKKSLRKGETQMVAFIRDPQCIFTYWEVTPESIEAVKQKLTNEYKDSSMVLRIFKTGPKGETELIQEIRVEPGEMNRYVQLKDPSGSYFVEIAQKALSGRVVVYARSNQIMTGISSEPAGDSPVLSDNKWESPEFFLEYFADADEKEVALTIPGISSAEAYRKELQRKKLDRYSASRIG